MTAEQTATRLSTANRQALERLNSLAQQDRIYVNRLGAFNSHRLFELEQACLIRLANVEAPSVFHYYVLTDAGKAAIAPTEQAASGDDGSDGDAGEETAERTYAINDNVTWEGRPLRVIDILSSGELILYDDKRNCEVPRLFRAVELEPATAPEPEKRFDIEIITFDTEWPELVAEAREKMAHLRSLDYRFVSTTSAYNADAAAIITTVIMELES